MEDKELQEQIAERLASLPQVVQDAIASGHIQEHFRTVAGKYQLHLDTWQQIEDLIMMTVLGLSKPEDLDDRIIAETGIDAALATTIVDDVAKTIFLPIREELERELGHPQAKEAQTSNIEKVRQAALVAEGVKTNSPPQQEPEKKMVPIGPTVDYKPGQTSATRPTVADDPYREPLA
jgi:hypothetical protein